MRKGSGRPVTASGLRVETGRRTGPGMPSTVCPLALLTHRSGEPVVKREARHLVPSRGVSPRRTVDHACGSGMERTPGRE